MNPSQINEAVLLQGLGVDPNTVRAGTVQVGFQNGTPVLTYTVVVGVDAAALAAATTAAVIEPDDAPEGDQEEER